MNDRDKEELDFRRAIYAAQVDSLDSNIGRLVEHLEKKGVLDNTLIMFFAVLVYLALGWLIGRTLGLDRSRMGPFILATGFGNSSLLGFALVSEVFSNNDQAMAEAIVLSSLGSQPLLFTLGTMIAIYYGDTGAAISSRRTDCDATIYRPIPHAND